MVLAVVAAGVAAVFIGVTGAQAAGPPGTGAVPALPDPSEQPPAGRESTRDEVVAAALRAPRIRQAIARHPRVQVLAFLEPEHRWRVSVYSGSGDGRREIAQALVSDRGPRVLEAWTGVQARWPMARGYHGAFGGRTAALYVWLALLGLFLLPFLRPPWRLLHLDLAAIASLSVSFAFFNAGRIALSVPLAYPPLVYLLVRLLAVARSPAARGAGPLRVVGGVRWLGLAAVFLVGARISLTITGANVIDVGYAGVIGADRIASGSELYGAFPSSNPRGDTYGPLAYLAYLPFELVWPWHGSWDDLMAARVAAVVFDLACLGLLWWFVRREAGAGPARVAAYLWTACPFTLLVAGSAANDALVGALVLLAVVVAARPAARGAAAAAGALTKVVPLVALPLLATYAPPRAQLDRGILVRTAAGAVAVAAPLLTLVLVLDGDLRGLWERSVTFQAGRESPFSVWGLYDLGVLQTAAQIAVVTLAAVAAFLPRHRDPVTLAALSGAVLLAVQLAMGHWFYLYVAWVLPVALAALVAAAAGPPPVSLRPGAAQVRSRPPVAAASSG